MREDLGDLRTHVDTGFAKVDENFGKVNDGFTGVVAPSTRWPPGQQQIVDLLDRLTGPDTDQHG